MMLADRIGDGPQTFIAGQWVKCRPIPGDFLSRLTDAWAVLLGRADAVRWEGQ